MTDPPLRTLPNPPTNHTVGGRWLLDIHIPPTYPLSPPSIRFVTPICHPNVDFKTGEICLDTLKTSWTPVYTISATMTAIHQLLTSAEPDSPLNVDVAQLFRVGDDVGARSLIRFYTETERWNGGVGGVAGSRR
jgi:peroxin-4